MGITQAVYPVAQDLKTRLLLHLLERNVIREALVFTRTKHRANRLWEFLSKQGIAVGRIHGNRSQAQRTDALDGFKSGSYRVLVATDIAARGIDVEALGHVVNFDVPVSAEDYMHRVGRTARAELTGEAFTFASPDESEELRAIERVVGKPLLRVTVPDFDYSARPTAKFEIPIAERIAEIRAAEGAGTCEQGGERDRRPAAARRSASGRCRTRSAPARPTPRRARPRPIARQPSGRVTRPAPRPGIGSAVSDAREFPCALGRTVV